MKTSKIIRLTLSLILAVACNNQKPTENLQQKMLIMMLLKLH